LVEEVSAALFKRGAVRLTALVEGEHAWATGFWDSLSSVGYEHDPKFVRYIRDRDRSGSVR
jgi:hypothetical protein